MLDWKMFLSPEMRAGVDVATGEKPSRAVKLFTGSQFRWCNSLGGTEQWCYRNVDAATKQFAQADKSIQI